MPIIRFFAKEQIRMPTSNIYEASHTTSCQVPYNVERMVLMASGLDTVKRGNKSYMAYKKRNLYQSSEEGQRVKE